VPDFTEARNNRGRILFGLDRGDDAVENFTIAIRINPRDAEAWYRRGRHLLDLSRNDEATADLAQALLLRAAALISRSASNSRGFAV
jgi:Flp pilus assembly protein TadD